MKICITATSNDLTSPIDPRFGRCCYFIIWDEENKTFKAIANPNIDAGSGAGINSAQLVVAEGVKKVLTGEVGPKAEKVLTDAEVEIIRGFDGLITVKNAIERYDNNKTVSNSTDEIPSNQSSSDTQIKSGAVLERYAQKILNRPLRSGQGLGRRGCGCGLGLGRGRGNGVGGTGKGLGRRTGGSLGRRIFGNFGQKQTLDTDYYCICPMCGEKQLHQPGVPCRSVNCPKCGTAMRMPRE